MNYLSNLSLPAILELAESHLTDTDVVFAELRSRYRRLLLPFVGVDCALDTLLVQHSSYISGPIALAFVFPEIIETALKPEALHIYTPKSAYKIMISHFLSVHDF